jgi:AmpE protein
MTLISLLIALAVERVIVKSPYWHYDFYFSRYLDLIEKQGWGKDNASMFGVLALSLIPSILIGLLSSVVLGFFLGTLLNLALLLVCLGCPMQRASYKGFLRAAQQGDMTACDLYSGQMGHDVTQTEFSFGQNLVWTNYSHYAAVIIAFVFFGGAGAVFYVLARNIAGIYVDRESQAAKHAEQVLYFIDWIPVRITALGFLLVGHFSRAMPIWLAALFNKDISAKSLLADVSKAAEEIDTNPNDCTEEPCTMVRLAKRNVIFLLMVLSLLTLAGVVS